ncbi:hypothetical protein E2320_000716 [Naja naja]|nr:hypothetical protein E2320_000716 [Naja naja]
MDRFFFFLVLGVLVGLVCCSGKGGRYGEEKESLLSRSKRSKLWHRSCTCPDLNELQNPKKHNHACPCDGFSLHSLSEHRKHRPHRKSKQHALRKAKCKRFLKHCAFNGMHIPL